MGNLTLTQDDVILRDLPAGKSLDDMPVLHKKVLIKVAELAEPAIRLQSPFDKILQTGIKARQLGYDKVEGAEKEELLLWQIAASKYIMCGNTFFNPEFQRKLSEFEKIHRIFSPIVTPPGGEWVDDKAIISNIVRSRMPEFVPDRGILKFMKSRKMRTEGVQIFSAKCLKDNKIFVIFLTRQNQSVRTAIGIMKPFFIINTVDPWYVYSGNHFYHNMNTCLQAVNAAIDVIEIVLPMFLKKLEEALCH